MAKITLRDLKQEINEIKDKENNKELKKLLHILNDETVTPYLLNKVALICINEDYFLLFSLIIKYKKMDLGISEDLLFRRICELNRIEMYKLIIKNKYINVNACLGKPLIRAVEKNNYEIVKLLLEHSDIEAFNRFGKAFRLSFSNQDNKIWLLFKEHKDYEKNLVTINFEIAATYVKDKEDDLAIVNIQDLVNGLSNSKVQQLFQIALTGKKYKLADFLISKGADINAFNGKYITAALLNKNQDTIDFLEKYENLKWDIRSGKLVYFASSSGDLELLKFLISKGLSVEKGNFKALKLSVEENREDVIEYLMNNELKGKITSEWVKTNINNEIKKEKMLMSIKLYGF